MRMLKDVPNQDTLQELLLTFFNEFHPEGQQKLDNLLAIFDGCVLRVDATFASVKGLGAYVKPSEVNVCANHDADTLELAPVPDIADVEQWPDFDGCANPASKQRLETIRRLRHKGDAPFAGFTMQRIEGQQAALQALTQRDATRGTTRAPLSAERKEWATFSSCLFTVTGRAGFVLRPAVIAAGESHAELQAVLSPILKTRSVELGIAGIPDGIAGDNPNRDANVTYQLVADEFGVTLEHAKQVSAHWICSVGKTERGN